MIRVFPRRTNATPIDGLVRFDEPGWFEPEVDRVHVSVTFTYDMDRANYLAEAWQRRGYAVEIGGPATGRRSGVFIPGIYLKKGYVITSRGCPNRCWFCSVWRREGDVRELPITEGTNVLDDNLLACSDSHILSVFKMLKQQKGPKQFTGGLEAARLKDWHIALLQDLKPKQIFCAYDTPDDLEPLIIAGRKLLAAGFTKTSKTLRAYVLIGYAGDTIAYAEKRLNDTLKAGFVPMAMLYRRDAPESGELEYNWRKFQRQWVRPAIRKEVGA